MSIFKLKEILPYHMFSIVAQKTSYNLGQNICDTYSNYLTKYRNIISPFPPPFNVDWIRRIRIKRPTLFWGVEGGKRVNYSGLTGKKSHKGMF